MATTSDSSSVSASISECKMKEMDKILYALSKDERTGFMHLPGLDQAAMRNANSSPYGFAGPKPDKATLKQLNKEMMKLYEYNEKAKHQINKDGSVTFWPTPNCK